MYIMFLRKYIGVFYKFKLDMLLNDLTKKHTELTVCF